MKIIDISQMLDEPMALYPSLIKFNRRWLRHYSMGDNVSVSAITMACHCGSHIDAPYHYYQVGKRINEIDLELFYGSAMVIEIPDDADRINIDLVEKYDNLEKRVLFKTSNSKIRYKEKQFREDYVYVTDEVAQYLVEKGVRLVGIDYVSIDGKKEITKPVHKILLENNVLILEGLDLINVVEGKYLLVCFPIKIKDAEGSPCRAVLIYE